MKYLLIIPIIIGLTYCTTSPSLNNNSSLTDISNSVDQDALALENIRMLIEDASLFSLHEALKQLEVESVGLTEQGEYYKFIAVSLLKLIFPYSEKTNIRVINPKSGMYTEIVNKAEEGAIIEIANEDVSFFTLVLSSTAALYTKSDAVMAKSLDILESIYSPDSMSFLPVYIRSFIFEKQNLFSDAFNGYIESLKIDSSSYVSEMGVIRILIRNGEFRKALSQLEKIQELYGQYSEIRYLHLDALIGNNELEKALILVSESLAANPDDILLTLKYADILQRQGQNSRALYMINSIESNVGESSASVRIRASILVNEKEYSQAIILLEKAVKKYSDDSEFRDLFGHLLLIAGKEGEGRVYLEDSLEINPDSLESLRLLTEEAIASKSWIRASEFVEKLLVKEIIDIYLRYAVIIYHNRDNNNIAVEYNLKIINEGQPLQEDYLSLINMLIEDGDSADAFDIVNRWIERSKSSSDRSYFYYLKSLVLNDPQAKLEILRKALFENLQNLDAIIAISDVYYILGEKRNSYRYLKQALILVPEDEPIKEKLRKLEKEL
jgi:tetratricopeptide (TPR) repeat protein